MRNPLTLRNLVGRYYFETEGINRLKNIYFAPLWVQTAPLRSSRDTDTPLFSWSLFKQTYNHKHMRTWNHLFFGIQFRLMSSLLQSLTLLYKNTLHSSLNMRSFFFFFFFFYFQQTNEKKINIWKESKWTGGVVEPGGPVAPCRD